MVQSFPGWSKAQLFSGWMRNLFGAVIKNLNRCISSRKEGIKRKQVSTILILIRAQ
jgi:hypothetical protein